MRFSSVVEVTADIELAFSEHYRVDKILCVVLQCAHLGGLRKVMLGSWLLEISNWT